MYRNKRLIEVDTPTRMRDHYRFLRAFEREGTAHALMTGLGLGTVARAALLQPGCETLTVVEVSQEVIDLVRPALRAEFGDRIRIVCADARKVFVNRLDGRPWDIVWHDIWDQPSPDIHDVPIGTWLVRNYKQRLAVPPRYQSYPRRYELVSELRKRYSRWAVTPFPRWKEMVKW